MLSIFEKKNRVLLVLISAGTAAVIAAVTLAWILIPKSAGATWSFPAFSDTLGLQGVTFVSQDPNLTFDGSLDDTAWKNQRWLDVAEAVDDSIRVKTTSYFGKDGLYMAFDVNDLGVYFSKTRLPALNSGIQLYLSSMNGADSVEGHSYEIMLTAGGLIQVNKYQDGSYAPGGGGVQLAVKLKGELNTATCKGYTMEALIPYAMLDDDHQSVYASPAIVRSMSKDGTYRQWYWFGQELKASSWTRASTWWTFDKGGLVAHTVKLTGDENGSLTGNDFATDGDNFTFWLTPKDGYYADNVTVNGSPLKDEPLYKAGKAYYSISSVKGDLDIAASFKKVPAETVSVSGKVNDGKNAVDGAAAWAVKNGFAQSVPLEADGSFSASVPALSGLKIYAEAAGYLPGIASVPSGGGKVNVTLQKTYVGENANVNRISTNYEQWDLSRLYENKVRLKTSGISATLVNSEIYSNTVYASANIVVPVQKGVDSRAGFTFYDNAGHSAFIALTMNGEVNKSNPQGNVYYSMQAISGDSSWSYDGTLLAFDNPDQVKAKADSAAGISVAVHYRNGVIDIWVDGTQIGIGIVPKDKSGNPVFASGSKVAVGLESWLCATEYSKLTFDGSYPIPDASQIPKIVNGWDLSKRDQGTVKSLTESAVNTELTDSYADIVGVSANITLPKVAGKDTRAGFNFKNQRGDNVFVALTMNGEVNKNNPEGKLYYSLQFISYGSSWNQSGTINDIQGWSDLSVAAGSSVGVPVSVYAENGLFTVGINGYQVADKVFPADKDGNNIFARDTKLQVGLESWLQKVTFSNIQIGTEKPTLKTRISADWDLSKLTQGKVSLTKPVESTALLWTEYRSKMYLSANVTLTPVATQDVRTGFRFTDEEGNIVFVALLNDQKDSSYKLQIIAKPAGGTWQWPIARDDVNGLAGLREAVSSAAGAPFAAAFDNGKISAWLNGKNVLDNVLVTLSGHPLFADDAKVNASLECWSYAGQFHKIAAYDKRP